MSLSHNLLKLYVYLFSYRIFDKDDDGLLTVEELRKIMSSLGDRMTSRDIDIMVKEADTDNDGFINCKGNISWQVYG